MRFTPAPLLLGFLVLTGPIVALQDLAHREKVAEGEYSRWRDGHPIEDTGLSWTIWRTQDGLDVEATLPPDKGAFIAASSSGSGGTTPELKKDIQNSSVAKSVDLKLSKVLAFQRMILEGVSLRDLKQVRVTDCDVSGNEISCAGRDGKLHAKSEGPLQFLYSYPYPLPMSFTSILRNNKPAENQSTPLRIAMLDDVKHKLQLTEISGQLYAQGTDKINLGEHIFETEKYLLVLATKAGDRKITVWTKNNGIVFAMEDSQLEPGVRIQLNRYKRYSNF